MSPGAKASTRAPGGDGARGERARPGARGERPPTPRAGEREADRERRQERVAAIQRSRILSAVYEVCAERGIGELTVGAVISRAGISRRTFYEQFESIEACVLAAIERALIAARARVMSAYDREDPWRVRLRAGLVALLEHLDEHPLHARMLLVDCPGAGRGALELRARALAGLVAAVEEGAPPRPSPARPPTTRAARRPPATLMAEGVVGGAVSVLHTRLLGAKDVRLVELTNPLMSILVLPYLGPAAAAAELDRRVEARALSPVEVDHSPLRKLEMRLTYRTMCVLGAVADAPGASNRAVSEAAGVFDQGQISKLLRRLEGLGLLENTGDGTLGSANAWTLTLRGRRLCESFAHDGGGVGCL